MTEVILRKNDLEYSLEIKNHHENTLACAGISAIAWALAGALNNWFNPDELTLEDGYVNIRAKKSKRSDKFLDGFFFMAYVGLMQIGKEYPGTISFSLETGENLKSKSPTICENE